MFPVEHSLSFQPEGSSLLRSLRNGGRIFAAWSARTRAVTVDAERGERGKYDGRHKTRKWNKDPQTGCGFSNGKVRIFSGNHQIRISQFIEHYRHLQAIRNNNLL
jgi:hypothetical protein